MCRDFLASPRFRESPPQDLSSQGGTKAAEEKRTAETISFCCGKSKSKSDKDPSAFLGKVAAAKDGTCPVSGEEADKDETSTITTGPCCSGCKKKVDAAPRKFLAKIAGKQALLLSTHPRPARCAPRLFSAPGQP